MEELAGRAHLVCEEQGLEPEGVAMRPDGDEMRLRPEHEAADPDHPGGAHGSEQQRVWLLGAPAGDRRDVIALLVTDRLDLSHGRELLDFDRAAPFGSDRNELALRDR